MLQRLVDCDAADVTERGKCIADDRIDASPEPAEEEKSDMELEEGITPLSPLAA